MRLLTLCCAAPFFTTLAACGATGPNIEHSTLNELPQARNDAALVYFFRPDSGPKSRHNRYIYVYDDFGDVEDFLGGVQPGTFFFVHVLPGAHNFSCLEINLEAGQTYFLKQELWHLQDIDPVIKVSRFAPIDLCPPNFVAVTPEYAQPIIADLTYTVVKKD